MFFNAITFFFSFCGMLSQIDWHMIIDLGFDIEKEGDANLFGTLGRKNKQFFSCGGGVGIFLV